jgi:hypothetical protein
MNNSQTIFSLFYAVLYGSMLTSLGSLRAFPWGFLAEPPTRRKQLIIRLMISIFIFNILPFIIFAWGIMILNGSVFSSMCIWNVLASAISSLSVFCPYRIYHFILAVNPIFLYQKSEWDKIGKVRTFRKSKFGHFLAAILYLIPMIILSIIYKIT